MADDDHNQRIFRTDEQPQRDTRPANDGTPSDPLAELARLIGQSDPFGEFRRDPRSTAPPSVTPRTSGPAAPGYGGNAYFSEPPTSSEPAAPPSQPVEPNDLPPPYARRFSSSAPSQAGTDRYDSEEGMGSNSDEGAAGDYEHEHYEPSQAPFGPEEEEFYEDARPRRRVGVIAIAGVFALAVIGAAGAFGYRALFRNSTSGPPPVIKADTVPSKIPAPKKETHSAKLNDRMNDQEEGNKLVSREEQPVDIKDQPASAFPQTESSAGAFPPAERFNVPPNASQPTLGSGIIAGVGEPRKVHTIVIRPDESNANSAAVTAATAPPAPAETAATSAPISPPPAAALPEKPAATPPNPASVKHLAKTHSAANSIPISPPPAAAPPEKAAATPKPAPVKHVAKTHSAAKSKAIVHHAEVRTTRSEHRRVAAAHSYHRAAANAPLSLSPGASIPAAPVRTTRAPMRTAAAAPTTTIEPQARSQSRSKPGGYAVQISSRHSKAEAEAAFRRLQAKFPSQLGGREPLIRRVDLGSKGIYYRALVGPFANSAQAGQMCSNLKAAGGSCFVQRI